MSMMNGSVASIYAYNLQGVDLPFLPETRSVSLMHLDNVELFECYKVSTLLENLAEAATHKDTATNTNIHCLVLRRTMALQKSSAFQKSSRCYIPLYSAVSCVPCHSYYS